MRKDLNPDQKASEDDAGRFCPVNHPRPLSVAAAANELEVVWSFLEDWPSGLYRVLDLCRDSTGKFMGEGLQQAFGNLYVNLYRRKLFTPELDFVRLAFEKYVDANWIGIVDRKYRRITQEKPGTGYVSLTPAAKRFHMRSKTLSKLVKVGAVKGTSTQRPSGRHYTILTPGEMEDLSKKMGNRVNGSAVRRILGLSKRQFHVLVETGEIMPEVIRKYGEVGEWWFDAGKIEKLLKDIMARAPKKKPDAEAISFSKACQSYLLGAKLLPAFLQGIRAGSVQIAGCTRSRNTKNLKSLYFSSSELAAFRVMQVKAARTGIYSVPEAAERLRVKQEVAYHLVNRGFLETTQVTGAIRFGRFISESAITSFQEAYVSLIGLARPLGISSRLMKKRLTMSGVIPVTGRGVDGCRQVFYRRKDVLSQCL